MRLILHRRSSHRQGLAMVQDQFRGEDIVPAGHRVDGKDGAEERPNTDLCEARDNNLDRRQEEHPPPNNRINDTMAHGFAHTHYEVPPPSGHHRSRAHVRLHQIAVFNDQSLQALYYDPYSALLCFNCDINVSPMQREGYVQCVTCPSNDATVYCVACARDRNSHTSPCRGHYFNHVTATKFEDT